MSAAIALVNARDDGNGKYESIDDVRNRSGVNKAVIELLREEGVLEGRRRTILLHCLIFDL